METVAKRKQRRRRSFTPEFKADIVERCRKNSGGNFLGIATSFPTAQPHSLRHGSQQPRTLRTHHELVGVSRRHPPTERARGYSRLSVIRSRTSKSLDRFPQPGLLERRAPATIFFPEPEAQPKTVTAGTPPEATLRGHRSTTSGHVLRTSRLYHPVTRQCRRGDECRQGRSDVSSNRSCHVRPP